MCAPTQLNPYCCVGFQYRWPGRGRGARIGQLQR